MASAAIQTEILQPDHKHPETSPVLPSDTMQPHNSGVQPSDVALTETGVRSRPRQCSAPVPSQLHVMPGARVMRTSQTSPARLTTNSSGCSAFCNVSTHSPAPQQRDRALSECDPYYGSVDPAAQVEDHSMKRFSTKQSRHLPHWAWSCVTAMLGIPATGRGHLGMFLRGLTVLLALFLVTCFAWYTVYDIISRDTKSTVLSGLVSIVMITYWCSLGVYGNKLAQKLFSFPSLVACVRLHSKTIFKLSSAAILSLLALASVALNDYATYINYSPGHCHNITVPRGLCTAIFTAQCCFSVLCLVWNLMVGVVLLSVCRTHTIGIRRFIHQLELDGRLYERCRRHMDTAGSCLGRERLTSQDTEDEYLWDDDLSPLSDQYLPPATYSRPTTPAHRPHSPDDRPLVDPVSDRAGLLPVDDDDELIGAVRTRPTIVIRQSSDVSHHSPAHDNPALLREDEQNTWTEAAKARTLIRPDPPSHTSRSTQQSTRVEAGSPYQRQSPASFASLASQRSFSHETLNIMSPDEILLGYWRISCRLRSSSLVLQRWVVAVVMFILLFCSTLLFRWINHEATLLSIAQLVLPLLILPLITAAYGEVNNEGRRMLRCICPMEERVKMMLMLVQQPLEMTVFGYPINYATIATIIGAIALAFGTKIILEEIK